MPQPLYTCHPELNMGARSSMTLLNTKASTLHAVRNDEATATVLVAIAIRVAKTHH